MTDEPRNPGFAISLEILLKTIDISCMLGRRCKRMGENHYLGFALYCISNANSVVKRRVGRQVV
jgi:hypothetical protein